MSGPWVVVTFPDAEAREAARIVSVEVVRSRRPAPDEAQQVYEAGVRTSESVTRELRHAQEAQEEGIVGAAEALSAIVAGLERDGLAGQPVRPGWVVDTDPGGHALTTITLGSGQRLRLDVRPQEPA